MAAATSEGDLEELVDPGLGMEEESGGLKRGSLRGSYHSDSLLAPDGDSLTDGRSSAASNLDVADRLTYLEQRMQMQEDEIQLLKMTLADVLKRLNISEEHRAASAPTSGRRTSGTKGRPVSMGLPPRAPLGTSGVTSLRKSSTLPSGATCRNYSPTPPRCGVRSPAGSVKDSPCKTPKTRPSSSASSCTSTQEGSTRSKEVPVSLGMRRVTHSKVTMQIYLSPLIRKTGSSEMNATSTPTVPVGGSGPSGTQQARGTPNLDARRKDPSYMLNLQKTTTNVASQKNPQQDANSSKNPQKSPSQYFQICY
ncbi:echinoderm microtubule-associated protein-like 1 isoform X2 [Corythoichthys intestinalis]|uniref:echinoderm microtubule-associated protein-like 1 isoform X2 n=1 Tax=Corythoichthys intestinalis TaxID=161448 RepID=UPI0025A602C4|nr:echinoderm microtubule-associated protein-like 1 isoform X2 [Corythoichthys intestinalis]